MQISMTLTDKDRALMQSQAYQGLKSAALHIFKMLMTLWLCVDSSKCGQPVSTPTTSPEYCLTVQRAVQINHVHLVYFEMQVILNVLFLVIVFLEDPQSC